jgi:hypothetical protein
MSKTTLSVLSSILLGSAFALLPAASMATPNTIHHGLWNSPAARFAEHRAEHGDLRERNSSAKPAANRPGGLDVNYTIINRPLADPTWGTRVNGINESSVVSGQYVNKDDGTFHAFLRTPDDNFPIDIQVGHNDTFAGFLNDEDETFGSYIDNDTGLENAWVRTKDGAVTALQPPDGTNGSYGQFINNKGVLLGNYVDENGAIHSFVRTRKGSLTELADALNAGAGIEQGTQGIGINNKGEVSGVVIDSNNHFYGFVRSTNGSYAEFEAPGAGSGEFQGTFAAEINDREWVNGQVVDANDVMHGFIRDPDGNYTIVNAPDAGTGPGQGTVAVEHCEAGWCIGEYIDSNDVSHGYYRTKRGKIVEFDPPGAGDIGTYVVISSNKARQIAGTFKDDNGIRHGFIRNP